MTVEPVLDVKRMGVILKLEKTRKDTKRHEKTRKDTRKDTKRHEKTPQET